MGGISFIHAGFLAGLATVAIPVVVHLLFRQKPRLVGIGSVHFLKVVLRDHVRRRKLRRWLLLALRVAGVALLALLFARPYWPAAGEADRAREVAIVIDQSASMAAAAGGRTAFERAQAEARAYIERLPERTVVHLAYADAGPVEALPEPRIDRRRGPGFGATDLGKALAWGRDVLTASTRADRRVVLVTDLQRPAVEREPLGPWPPDVVVEILDVGRPLSSNLAVMDAGVSRTEIRKGEPPVVAAVVANTGVFPCRDAGVRLRLKSASGQAIERMARVAVDAGASQVVRWSLNGLAPGLYRGEVQVDLNDDLPPDNTRWVAFDARSVDRVLLVDGAPGDSPFAGQTYYLETALRLRPPGAPTATPYEPVRLAWTGTQRLPDLAPYAVVVLCDVGTFADADLSALREFVALGGRLVVFAGGQVTAAVSARLREARIVPVEFLGTTEAGEHRLATWDKAHPLLAAFSDPQHGDLRRLEFRRLSRLKPDAEARVLARDGDGNPWLVEGTLGTGTILAFAVPANRDWGDWPVSRLYVPLVHQVLGYLTHRLPESRRTRELAAGPGRAHPPGVEFERNRVVSRNLDSRESDGGRIAPDALRRMYHLPAERPRSQAQAAPPGAARADEFWRALVWALCAILVVETFVANRTHA